jgi:hypothetical protein
MEEAEKGSVRAAAGPGQKEAAIGPCPAALKKKTAGESGRRGKSINAL